MSAVVRPRPPRERHVVRAGNGRVLELVRVVLVGVVLNLCWLVGCVPVVTAVSSTAALHTAVGRWRGEGEEPTPGSFLRDLRRTLRPGAGTALVAAAVAAVLAADLSAIGAMGGQRRVVLVVWLALALGSAAVALWLPPVLASARRPTLRSVVGTAGRCAVRHPVRSLGAVAFLVGLACLLGLSPILCLVLPAPAALALGRLLDAGETSTTPVSGEDR